jgi:hypothetical protein
MTITETMGGVEFADGVHLMFSWDLAPDAGLNVCRPASKVSINPFLPWLRVVLSERECLPEPLIV